MDYKKSNNEKGVALLFAVLLVSALLLVTLGIASVSYRETLFAVEARDSGISFFAADTGIECALYLDSNQVFATSSPSGTCRNTSIVFIPTTSSAYTFALPVGTGACTEVFIDKGYNGGTETEVRAFGYNAPYNSSTNSCATNVGRFRTVSRALRTHYLNP